MKMIPKALSTLLFGVFTSVSHAADVEVMHWWTSGSEATSIGVLKSDLSAKGIGWKDVPVAGGGGNAALTALKARVSSGNAPTATQISLMGVQEWAAEGLLGDLTPLAEKGGWKQLLPPAVAAGAMYEDKWVAVPFNIHRSNWLWMNARVFQDNGLVPPTTLNEFYSIGDKLKAKGIIPLALGGEPWQETIIFEDTIVAVGGAELYRKAILSLDPEALGSEQMKKVFDEMRKIRGYTDSNSPGRVWNSATAMVLKGQAAMQLMGDWAKGEIVSAHLKPGVDILCSPAPGTQGTFLFHVDYFEMFEVPDERKQAQIELASSIMTPDFQETFNLAKGSIPARNDTPKDRFDACARKSMSDLDESVVADNLLGNVQGGAAQTAAVQGAIQDVVTQHFNSNQSSEDAVRALVRAVKAAR